MMNETELLIYYKKHNLCEALCNYINLTRGSEPSRTVGENGNANVCTWVISRKMGKRQIQTESRTVEKSFVFEFEYDDSVIEYWEQPEPISIRTHNKNGNKHRRWYRPDFLLLTTTGPKLIETKSEEILNKLYTEKPLDWFFKNKTPCFQPAVETCRELGIVFEVCSSAELNLIRTANLRLILRSRSYKDVIDDLKINKMKVALKEHAWMRMSELAEYLNIQNFTYLLQCIDRKVI